MSCIHNVCEPLVTAEDVYEAFRIALAAIDSMASGESVAIEDAAFTLTST